MRIAEPMGRKRGDFSSRLEQTARDLVSHGNSQPSHSPIAALLTQNIALALEQLDSLRDLHQDQLRSLTRAECYVDTEIIQLEQATPRYTAGPSPERDKFHHRLFLIEAERRKHAMAHEERMRGLQRHLLSLIQKHGQLSGR